MTKATQLFINASVSVAGMEHADWESYLQGASWHFPAASATKSQSLHRIFNSYRINEERGYKVKARSSELLGLYGLLRHFVETRAFPEAMHPVLKVFLASCKIVDICLAAKRRLVGLRQSAGFLRAAVRDYLRLHKLAFDTRHLTPKVHWLFDIADQMEIGAESESMLLDALVIERIHLTVKAVAYHVTNTRTCERSVLEGVVNEQHYRLESMVSPLANDLSGKRESVSPTLELASKMDVHTATLSVGDVVFCNDECRLITCCARQAGELLLIVDVMPRRRYVSDHSVQLDPVNVHRRVWAADRPRLALAWSLDIEQ